MTTRFFLLIAGLGATVAAQNPAPAPQRTILENRVTQGKSNEEQPATAPVRSIDSVLDSTVDLNAIRDQYVRRLAGDGCRPDVAVRVAELRARLQQTGPLATKAQGSAATPQTSSDLEGSLLILAAGWYQPRNEKATPRASRDTERSQLLEFVLSPKDPQSQAASGQEAGQLKAELDQLLATCRGGGR